MTGPEYRPCIQHDRSLALAWQVFGCFFVLGFIWIWFYCGKINITPIPFYKEELSSSSLPSPMSFGNGGGCRRNRGGSEAELPKVQTQSAAGWALLSVEALLREEQVEKLHVCPAEESQPGHSGRCLSGPGEEEGFAEAGGQQGPASTDFLFDHIRDKPMILTSRMPHPNRVTGPGDLGGL